MMVTLDVDGGGAGSCMVGAEKSIGAPGPLHAVCGVRSPWDARLSVAAHAYALMCEQMTGGPRVLVAVEC